MTDPMTVIDTVFNALADSSPAQGSAGHHADLCVSPGGTAATPKTERFLPAHMGPLGGLWREPFRDCCCRARSSSNYGDRHISPR